MSQPVLKRNMRGVAFLNHHPEWADMAYELLFRRSLKEPYDLQYAVAQAMMLAHEMGAQGRMPPRPKGMDPRRMEPPPPDPEIDAIYNELRMLAWSPLSGQPKPEGHTKWAMNRHFASKAQTQQTSRVVVARTKPAAVPVTRLVRRSK